MILINKSLCCTNLRRAAIIYSSINVTIRAIAMIALILGIIHDTNVPELSGWYSRVHAPTPRLTLYATGEKIPTFPNSQDGIAVESGIYATGLFFVGHIYVFLYGFLIYGLSSIKPSYLLVWLIFAPFEIIMFQVLLLTLDYVAMPAPAGIGVLALNLHLAITVFMFHNVCLVFTVRHNFISNPNGQNRNLVRPLGNATVITTNPSTAPSVNQYTQNNPTSSYYM